MQNAVKKQPNESLLYEDEAQFQTQLEEGYEKYQLTALSAEQLLKEYEFFKIDLFGYTIDPSKLNMLNNFLTFFNSKKLFIAIAYGLEKLYIYAEGSFRLIGNHRIFDIKQELFRTPNVIVSLAAFSGNRDVYVRQDALLTIFYQKWMPYFKHNYIEMEGADANRISEGIKQQTLLAFEATDEVSLEAKKKDFIKDMRETITYHELGHVVVQYDILKQRTATISEGTKVLGETIVMALVEILADFAPKVYDLMGPMQNMVTIAKTDLKRATRMFYMYASDIWFFDTQDTYMYLYSDLMALILLRYIKDDQTIHFKKIEHDMLFCKQEDTKKETCLFGFLLTQLERICTNIRQRLESTVYHLSNQDFEYYYIQQGLYSQMTKPGERLEKKSYVVQERYWNLLMTLFKMQPKPYKELMDEIDREETMILKKLFIIIAGKETAEAYNFNHRNYIFETLIKLGFTKQKSLIE